MLGIRHLKVPPTTYVMHYRGGVLRREGLGLSFFYFAPSSVIVTVPTAGQDVPFIFQEATADFQSVTVQGHLTFRVVDPRKVADTLDFSLLPAGGYATEDPEKLPVRLTNVAQMALRVELAGRTLKQTLTEADSLTTRVRAAVAGAPACKELGLELLDLAILAVKPTPETAKALEAEARERILRESDDAVYARRNNAVEQERRIKENELATEVAVEVKKRQVQETKLAAAVALEQKKQELVDLEAANARKRADTESYALEATLRPLAGMDPKALQLLAARGIDPRLAVAQAFQEIAANAGKVGTLNISPDLLESLLVTTPATPVKK